MVYTTEDIRRILKDLRTKGTRVGDWVIDASRALSIKLNDNGTVKSVAPGGQGDEAGVQPGWRITKVNESKVSSTADVIYGKLACRLRITQSVGLRHACSTPAPLALLPLRYVGTFAAATATATVTATATATATIVVATP